MSAPPTPKPAQPAPSSAPVDTTKPLEILPTSTSTLYSNLHPILLLSLGIFSFNRLVADPVNTLLGLAPTIAILQGVYCVLCLPSTGTTPSGPTKPGQKKKATKTKEDVWSKVVPASLSLLLTLTLTTPTLYLTLLLFGAPLTTQTLSTLFLALHLALLTTPALFYTHGLSPSVWLKLASLQVPMDEVYTSALGALLGAWVGAVPIPLDWDRAWQRWPVTVVVGVYGGAVVGKVLGAWVVKGRRVKMN